jgi:hypothetical protein
VPRAGALDELGLDAIVEPAEFERMTGLTITGREAVGTERTS